MKSLLDNPRIICEEKKKKKIEKTRRAVLGALSVWTCIRSPKTHPIRIYGQPGKGTVEYNAQENICKVIWGNMDRLSK